MEVALWGGWGQGFGLWLSFCLLHWDEHWGARLDANIINLSDAASMSLQLVYRLGRKQSAPSVINPQPEPLYPVQPLVLMKPVEEVTEPSAMQYLNEAVKAIQEPANQELRFEIKGYVKAINQPSYSLTLSERRAMAVRSYLVAQGVDAKRMIYQGYGEVRDEERVEFVLLDRSACE